MVVSFGYPLNSNLCVRQPQNDRSDMQQEIWMDRVCQSLAETQRIAQISLVAAYTNKDV